MNSVNIDQLLTLGATALRTAALSEEAKTHVLANPILFSTLKKAADRYIGGDTLEETVEKVQSFNQRGIKCSIEFMGESSRTEKIANAATDEFIRISDTIGKLGLNSTISLDLSHIGLAISHELCLKNLNNLCDKASANNIEVIISAEDTQRTDLVLDTYRHIARLHKNVGITLQAYLHRTQNDINEMMKLPGRIRIVKGAFETPPEQSLPRGEKLDNAYLAFIERLLNEQHLCSIATHDSNIQSRVMDLAKGSPTTNMFEFESLYGINNDQLIAIQQKGYPVKIYFVYGREWYLYLCNRLAEYPLNVFQALSDIVAQKRYAF